MDYFKPAIEWVQVNYPMILATLTAVGGVITTVYLIYNKAKQMLQPIKDWVAKKSTEEVDVKAKLEEKMKMASLETQIQDLKEKINNPTTSEDGRVLYTKQLEILIQSKALLDTAETKTEEITTKY